MEHVAVLIDPDLTDTALRQNLYEGGLVVLTRLSSVTALVEHTREQLSELFAAARPGVCTPPLRQGGDGEAPRSLETEFHPFGPLEGVGP